MIVLKNKTSDFIYLDVVTSYSKSLSSQVTQHPVDGSGTISDNVVANNAKFQIAGNITGADFNTGKPDRALGQEDRAYMGIEQIVVEGSVATAVQVSYTPLNFLPDFIQTTLRDEAPVVNNLNENRASVYSEKVLFKVLQGFQESREKLTLYEFDEGLDTDSTIENVFITSVSVREEATSGDSLVFDIGLEQIVISKLLEQELPEDVQEDFATRAAQVQKKGDKNAYEQAVGIITGESAVESAALALRNLASGG
jgi:hypothetical protein